MGGTGRELSDILLGLRLADACQPIVMLGRLWLTLTDSECAAGQEIPRPTERRSYVDPSFCVSAGRFLRGYLSRHDSKSFYGMLTGCGAGRCHGEGNQRSECCYCCSKSRPLFSEVRPYLILGVGTPNPARVLKKVLLCVRAQCWHGRRHSGQGRHKPCKSSFHPAPAFFPSRSHCSFSPHLLFPYRLLSANVDTACR